LRSLVLVVFLVLAAISAGSRVAFAQARTPAATPRAEDLARARALDQQGARAYGDGRYNDAIRYFEESHRLGGPPFELWNIAKCHAKLDQPDQAAEMLERYLATPTLPADDREEATQQLDALRRRPSTLTIASSPSGATVLLDGRPAEGGARTPTSFVVQPGTHTITLTSPSYASHTQQIEARYGRAIILDVPLGKDRRAAPPPPPPKNPYAEDTEPRRLGVRGHMGVMLPRYGSVGGAAHLTAALNATYRFAELGPTAFAAGVMLNVTGDSWDNTVDAPAAVPACGALRNPRSATAYSAFVLGTAGWEIVSRLRVHALAGAGVAAYSADDLGGDVFVPACNPAPGARPAMIVGAQLDYALTPLVRLSALPLLLQLQPSFEGTRSTPLDTSGIWLRATIAIGVGVDL
jgi:PEGA domain